MNRVDMLNLSRDYASLKSEIDLAIKNCLMHQIWVNGPEVVELENDIARYLGVKHCIGVASGTDALVISLRALAIKLKGRQYFDKGDEIITSSFTFSATGEAILRSGATPVFVDIDLETFNLDCSKIINYLKKFETHNVVGILPVHLYGKSCDIENIMKIAGDYGLFIVEDAAQAFGCNYKGKKLGSYGDAGAFSFYPTKNLGCYGNGGLIATNDDQIAEIGLIMREHGGKNKYDVSNIGYNSRLDTLQAAVLIPKLRKIDSLNNRRKRIAQIYISELSDIRTIKLPKIDDLDDTHVFHQFTIMCDSRDELQEYLIDNGIRSMVYYPVPLHMMKLFATNMINPEHPIRAETASKHVLSIPVAPSLTDDEVIQVADAIKMFKNN